MAADDLATAAQRLADVRDGVLPVARPDGTYLGVITAGTVTRALAQGDPNQTPANLLVELPSRVSVEDPVGSGVQALAVSGLPAVPVLDEDGRQIVGWFDHRLALAALEASPDRRTGTSAQHPTTGSR
jgi:CBS domain-containing protein